MSQMKKSPYFSAVDWFVDQKLKRWAKWSLSVMAFGLGYPSRSVEGRLLDGGGLLIKSTATPQMMYDEESENVEKLLNELGSYKPQLATALRLKYISSDIKKDLCLHSLAMPTFKKNLSEARAWMAASLQIDWQAYARRNAANQASV
jgi:hypothetical protein